MIVRHASRIFGFCVAFAVFAGLHPQAYCQDQPSPPTTPHRIHRMPTLDEQLKMLTQRLDLDSMQHRMVKAILEHRQAELLDVFRNNSLSAVDRFNAIKAVHDRANDRIAHLLNPEQAKKFDQMRNHIPAQDLRKPEPVIPPRS
jgi:hypothetical protein